MKNKDRLDNILVERGYFETKTKAQSAIMAHDVKVNGETITKSGYQLEFKEDTIIEVKKMPYVSRGGFKLEKAIKEFSLNFKDAVCLDAGASTGGFTDCLLQNGAKKVYAVDVGYGQLAWKVRQATEVKTIERTNIRSCEFSDIYGEDDETASVCVMDLSFISIKKVLENIKKLLKKDEQTIVALIKPQFEAGKELIGKNGVVKDFRVHIGIIKDIMSYAESLNLYPHGLTYSPIKGPAGNIEYLVLLTNNKSDFDYAEIEKTVEKAFLTL